MPAHSTVMTSPRTPRKAGQPARAPMPRASIVRSASTGPCAVNRRLWLHRLDRAAFDPAATEPVDRCCQRGHQLVVGELSFAFKEHPSAEAPGQRRFQRRHFRCIHMLEPRPLIRRQLVLQDLGEARQHRRIGCMRDDQGALLAEVDAADHCPLPVRRSIPATAPSSAARAQTHPHRPPPARPAATTSPRPSSPLIAYRLAPPHRTGSPASPHAGSATRAGGRPGPRRRSPPGRCAVASRCADPSTIQR